MPLLRLGYSTLNYYKAEALQVCRTRAGHWRRPGDLNRDAQVQADSMITVTVTTVTTNLISQPGFFIRIK